MDNNNGAVHSSFWANLFNTPPEKKDLRITLQNIPVFKDLSKNDIKILLDIVHLRNYLAGEYVFYQGDPGIGLYIIRDGEIEIKRNDEDGNSMQLASFGKGDFFGELALVDGEKRSASAIAKTDSRLAVIFNPDLEEFIEAYPRKGNRILSGLNQIIVVRLRTLNEDHFKLQTKLKINSEKNYGT